MSNEKKAQATNVFYVFIDGDGGSCIVNPKGETRAAVLEKTREYVKPSRIVIADSERTCCTKDGTRIKLLATANLNSDLEPATRVHAEGVSIERSSHSF